jgi:hypothetical protein
LRHQNIGHVGDLKTKSPEKTKRPALPGVKSSNEPATQSDQASQARI